MAEVPQVDRVFDALEGAALAAEGRPRTEVLPAVSLEDFKAAARLDAPGVRARLDRVVMGEDPERGSTSCSRPGRCRRSSPRSHAMVGFGDGEWRHKDVWKHTKQVVRQSVPRLEVRWAALFHDIGKVKTRSISPDGKVHFLGHAEVGHAHVRQARPAPRPLRAGACAQGDRALSRPAPPARQPVRARLDRQRRAPLRARAGRAPRRPALPRARRHHDQAPREEAQGACSRSRSCSSASASSRPRTRASRRCRAASATRS